MPGYQSGLEAAARKGQAVAFTDGLYTASFQATGILVGVAGNIVGKLLEDTSDITYPVTAGMNPLRFKTITESGTTATGLVVVRG
jgi:hypothetical protein